MIHPKFTRIRREYISNIEIQRDQHKILEVAFCRKMQSESENYEICEGGAGIAIYTCEKGCSIKEFYDLNLIEIMCAGLQLLTEHGLITSDEQKQFYKEHVETHRIKVDGKWYTCMQDAAYHLGITQSGLLDRKRRTGSYDSNVKVQKDLFADLPPRISLVELGAKYANDVKFWDGVHAKCKKQNS